MEDEIFAYTDLMTVTSSLVSIYPKEGDMVTAERGGNRKLIKLVNAGYSNGEGMIYTTDIPNVVSKVYKKS